MKSRGIRSWFIGYALCMPVAFHVLPHPGLSLAKSAEELMVLLGLSSSTADIYSDSLGLWLFMFWAPLVLLPIIRFLLSKRYTSFLRLLPVWILCALWIRYGWSKCLLLQFPEPSLSLVETPWINEDIRFWSFLGQQPLLSRALGIFEILLGASILLRPALIWVRLVSLLSSTIILALVIHFQVDVIWIASSMVLLSIYSMLEWHSKHLLSAQRISSSPNLQTVIPLLLVALMMAESLWTHRIGWQSDWNLHSSLPEKLEIQSKGLSNPKTFYLDVRGHMRLDFSDGRIIRKEIMMISPIHWVSMDGDYRGQMNTMSDGLWELILFAPERRDTLLGVVPELIHQ